MEETKPKRTFETHLKHEARGEDPITQSLLYKVRWYPADPIEPKTCGVEKLYMHTHKQ